MKKIYTPKNMLWLTKLVIIFFLSLFLPFGNGLSAQHSSHSHYNSKKYSRPSNVHHSTSHSTYRKNYSHRSNYKTGVQRDSHGKIKRSSSARYAFMKNTGYPHGRKGYVIDHIVPLSKGGCDCPANMQWQTIEEGKRKDKTERK